MIWERRLRAVVNRWRSIAISWDRNCGMFAADCVEAVSGVDPIKDIRDKIISARGFADVLKDGGGSLAAVVANRVGPPIAPRMARRGDIVGIDRRGLALGVCVGSLALFLDDVGLAALPMSEVTHAWSVRRG